MVLTERRAQGWLLKSWQCCLLFLDFSESYRKGFTWWKCIKLYTYDIALFYLNMTFYTSIKWKENGSWSIKNQFLRKIHSLENTFRTHSNWHLSWVTFVLYPGQMSQGKICKHSNMTNTNSDVDNRILYTYILNSTKNTSRTCWSVKTINPWKLLELLQKGRTQPW